MKECIVVLGMHRSGTSVMSGLISILGSYTGSSLMKPTEDNPKGYFENSKIYLHNEGILKENDASWDDYNFKLENVSPEKIKEYISLAKEVIEDEFRFVKRIVIKDPRFCLLFPIWEKALKELGIKIKVVFVYRSPMEVALSLKKRDNMPIEKGLMLWSHNFLLSEQYSRSYDRLYFQFNEDLYEYETFCERLSLFVGNEKLTPKAFKLAKEFYSPKLKHQNVSLDNISSDLPLYLKNIVEILINRDLDNSALLDDINNEYQQSKSFFLWNEKNLEGKLLVQKTDFNSKLLAQEESFHNKLQLKEEEKDNLEQELNDRLSEIQNILQKKEEEFSREKHDFEIKIEQMIAPLKKREMELKAEKIKSDDQLQQLNEVLNIKEGMLFNQKLTLESELENLNVSLKKERLRSKEEKQALQSKVDSLNQIVNETTYEYEKGTSLLERSSVVGEEILIKSLNHRNTRKLIQGSSSSFLKLKLLLNPFKSKASKKIWKEKIVIIESGLFSSFYYLSRYPDVWNAGLEPLEHYCKYGWREGRNPSRSFSTKHYLESNPDVAKSNINPLVHYILYGKDEGRQVGGVRATSEKGINTKIQSIESQNIQMKSEHGGKVLQEKLPCVLLVAHSAGDVIYGGERSFFDMVKAASKSNVNAIVVLPRKQQQIIDHIQPYTSDILVAKYGWWKKNNRVSEEAIEVFTNIINKYNISLVYTNTIMLREPLLAAKRAKVPSVIHIRELITGDKSLINLIGQDVEDIVSTVNESSDYIVANSQETANAYGLEQKTTIIHNTVDVNQFDIENEIGNILKVGIISSNLEKKGIFEFVQIAEICKEIEDLEFVLIGPMTDDVVKIKEYIEKENIRNLTISGYKSSSLEAISEANVILNISKFTESFGRTVLEGMAGRRPVIGYKWGALRELIVDGETGYLVPYLDVEEVAKKVKFLNSNRSFVLSMGSVARERAVNNFGFDAYCVKAKEFYRKVLNTKKIPALHKKESEEQRIAYFLWHFPVPSETFVLNELRVLVSNGYDVIVYCKQSPYPDFKPDFDISWEKVSNPKELAKKLKKTNRTIVHSHFTYPTVTDMVWPACEIAKIYFTFIAHAQDIFRYENIKRNKIGEISQSKYCRSVLIPSRFHRNYVIEHGVVPEKTLINPNGIDPNLYAKNRETTEVRDVKRSLCAIHRYTEKKGLEDLILSAPLINLKDVEIHIYGYGDLEEKYRSLIQSNDIKNVHVHGGVNGREEMLEVFSQNDAFLCPSVRAEDGDMDGIPTVLMEAMAYGIPVISTDLSGIPDLLSHKITGFITEPSPEGIAKTINEFYQVPSQQLATISQSAKDIIFSDYNSISLVNGLVRAWSGQKSLDIIIVSWNNLPELKEVIRRIQKYTSTNYNLIICDNDSEADVKQYLTDLQSSFENVIVYLNTDNSMVGPGSNIAIELGRADYIIYVCGKEGFVFDYLWEKPFISYMDENPDVGLGGTLCYSPTYLTGKQYPEGVALFDDFRNKHFAIENPERIFKHVQGGFFVMRREMYNQIGGFSEAVKHAYTDVEYSYYAESCGWKLGSINGVLSLYNKSRPTIYSRFDESIRAIHPPTLDELPLLDQVNQRTIKFCNICEWQGKTFDAHETCPSCNSFPDDRTLYRYLAESVFTFRRLSAIAVDLPSSLSKFWEKQFQGESLSLSKFSKKTNKNRELGYAKGGMQLFYYNNSEPQFNSFVLQEASRLLEEGGALVVQQIQQADVEMLKHKDVINFLIGHGFEFIEEISYSSSVVQYGWNRMWIFKKINKEIDH